MFLISDSSTQTLLVRIRRSFKVNIIYHAQPTIILKKTINDEMKGSECVESAIAKRFNNRCSCSEVLNLRQLVEIPGGAANPPLIALQKVNTEPQEIIQMSGGRFSDESHLFSGRSHIRRIMNEML